jgi:hypothetical protein
MAQRLRQSVWFGARHVPGSLIWKGARVRRFGGEVGGAARIGERMEMGSGD